MKAFFKTRATAPFASVELSLWFEDEKVAIDVVTYSPADTSHVIEDAEIILNRAQIDATIAALQSMRTMIDIRYPQPQIEASAVTA